MRTARGLTLLAACLLIAACDATSAGRSAYRDGRFKDALESFRSADDGSTAEIAWDRALAALRAGELDEAESAAQTTGTIDATFVPARDFLLGNVAFARCEAAEVETFRPGATPAVFDPAIVHAEAARKSWELAATSRPDWPEARRNVERAVLAAARLAARKADMEKNPEKTRGDKTPRPTPAAKPKVLPQPKQKETLAAMQEGELPRGEVLRILERLSEKEQQKFDLRRAVRRTQPATAEKDW